MKHEIEKTEDGRRVVYLGKSRGLGDTVEKVLSVTGVKKVVNLIRGTDEPCLPCEERRKKLNEAVPYVKSDISADKSS
jgi:hypothetical protein